MRVYGFGHFKDLEHQLLKDFAEEAEAVDVGQWQSLDVKGDRSKVTWELREASLVIGMPDDMESAQLDFRPNLPWAEDHFLERVSGKPLNPPPSQAWWPFAQNGHAEHVNGQGQFSHTYPERFWPRHAGDWEASQGNLSAHYDECTTRGIRFDFGDLRDVVERLRENPMTRQAYLPIWFPEDTGAPKDERVPCTLGYLFMIRKGQLHLTYHIRSCDFMRHWRDDVYMAVRLAQWMADQLLIEVTLGELTMHIGSFHIFEGDRPMVRHLLRESTSEINQRLLRSLG